MKSLLKVIYYDKYKDEGYQCIEFDMYSSFARWFIDNRRGIEIIDIKER